MSRPPSSGDQVHGSTAYRLGREVARGGEGAIFEVQGNASLYVKVYHNGLTRAAVDKIDALIRKRSKVLDDVAAWPIETVRNNRADVVGLLLPAIRNAKPLHIIISPANRLPGSAHAMAISLRTLAAVAANLSRAVAMFHAAGIVIGDLSGANVLVHPDGTVRLIDCDSVQIKGYPCQVALPDMLPPELQGCDLNAVTRTADHDIFALAVLVFQLLCVGRHPYSGGHGLALADAIRNNRHPFETKARGDFESFTGITFDDVMTAAVQRLLHKSFDRGMFGRPSAATFEATLKALHRKIVMCKSNGTHAYPGAWMQSCPWCALEKQNQPSYFAPSPVKLVRAWPGTALVHAATALVTRMPSIRLPARQQRTRLRSRSIISLRPVRGTYQVAKPKQTSPAKKKPPDAAEAIGLAIGLSLLWLVTGKPHERTYQPPPNKPFQSAPRELKKKPATKMKRASLARQNRKNGTVKPLAPVRRDQQFRQLPSSHSGPWRTNIYDIRPIAPLQHPRHPVPRRMDRPVDWKSNLWSDR